MSAHPPTSIVFGINLERGQAKRVAHAVAERLAAMGVAYDEGEAASQAAYGLGWKCGWEGFKLRGHGAIACVHNGEWYGADDSEIEMYAAGFEVPGEIVQVIRKGASQELKEAWEREIAPAMAELDLGSKPDFLVVSWEG
jgi:hypothetical protein